MAYGIFSFYQVESKTRPRNLHKVKELMHKLEYKLRQTGSRGPALRQ